MKKTFKIAVLAALALIISFSGMNISKAQAAQTGTADPQKYNSHTYTYTVEDFSTTITGKKRTVDVKCYYMVPSVSGYGKAGKKINKQLKSLFYVDADHLFEIAESVADEESDLFGERPEFCDKTGSWIEYNDEKYLSVSISKESWYGGVSNTFLTGYTFDLKTGKAVSITKATGLSLKKIKKEISEAMKAKEDEYDDTSYEYLDGMKAADFRYYLTKDDTCVVTFDPYELSFGGWYRSFEIKF